MNFFLLDRLCHPGVNPGRTSACEHVECFDLYNVELLEDGQHVSCPICGAVSDVPSLQEDRTVAKVVKAIKWSDKTRAWFKKRLAARPSSEYILRPDHVMDPMSLKKITIPVRGSDCAEHACFDLETYFLSYTNHGGICPRCQTRAPLSKLVIDTAVEQQLAVQQEADQETASDVVDVDTYVPVGNGVREVPIPKEEDDLEIAEGPAVIMLRAALNEAEGKLDARTIELEKKNKMLTDMRAELQQLRAGAALVSCHMFF